MPSPPLTPDQRVMRARIAANERWSRQDPKPATDRAREAFLARFENAVDPNRELPEGERARRALAARRAYFLRLSLKSARARQARKVGAK